MRGEAIGRRFGRALGAFLGAVLPLASALVPSPAVAQIVDCNRIALQLSSLGRNTGSERMQAAAQKQGAELARMTAYARSIGCDRPQFLFFGDRPPQCAGLNAQIQRMQANYGQLLRAATGDSGLKRELQNQYAVYCQGGRGREPNFLERLFGGEPDRTYPPAAVEPDKAYDETMQEEAQDRRPMGGSMAVCVRTCDGGYFPLTYSARRASLDNLQDLCTALCPNTEAKVYTRSLSGDMKSAVSAGGDAYTDMPNAFKFEKTFDSACTCKPSDRTWVEALVDAERLIGEGRKGDILVTPAKAEEMSRPILPGAVGAQTGAPGRPRKFDPRAAQKLLEQQKAADAETAADAAMAAQAPTASRESAGIDVGRDSTGMIIGPNGGEVRVAPSANGANRRLRFVDPRDN